MKSVESPIEWIERGIVMAKEKMTDEELQEFIMDGLKEDPRVDAAYLELEVVKGKPILNGRVASDEQVQILDEIMTDVLDVEKYDNNVWVDDELAFDGADEKDDVEELSFDDEEDMEPDDSFGSDEDDE